MTSSPAPRRFWSLVFLAFTLMTFLAASSVPTPLYHLYQETWAFSPATLTLIFGVYALSLLAALLSHPFFAADFPKTTGPELFSPAYLQGNQRLAGLENLPVPDLLATLIELTASAVAQAARHYLGPAPVAEILVSGGGAHNATLLAALARHLPAARLLSTAEAGVPPDAKEALLFAVLANETLVGRPALSLGKISLPG